MPPEVAPATPTTTQEPPAADLGRFSNTSFEAVFGKDPAVEVPPDVKEDKPKTEQSPSADEPKTEDTPAAETANPFKDLDALIKDDVPATPDPAKPATVEPPKVEFPEVQKVQDWATNRDVAQAAVNYAAQGYALDEAFKSGDIKQVTQLFDPAALNELAEHFYQANKEQWAQRLVNEANGVTSDPQVEILKREVAAMRNMLADRQRSEQAANATYQQQQALADREQRYQSTWADLFKAVNVTDNDEKEMLAGWVMNRIARDPQKAQQVQNGKFGAIKLTFSDVYRKYHAERKAAVTTTEEKRQTQEQNNAGKLATASGAGGETPTNSHPVDYDKEGNRTHAFWSRGLAAVFGIK